MRLIDADELKDQFSWSEFCRLSIKEINQIIDEAPTITNVSLPDLKNDDPTKDPYYNRKRYGR